MSSTRLRRMDAVINDYIKQGKQAGVGVLVASAMTFGAWRLIREQAKLPAEKPAPGAP